jgi:hypothetical protein
MSTVAVNRPKSVAAPAFRSTPVQLAGQDHQRGAFTAKITDVQWNGAIVQPLSGLSKTGDYTHNLSCAARRAHFGLSEGAI